MNRYKSLLFSLVALPCIVDAATVTVSWTPPTTCADQSPIANCPLTKYTVYSGLSGTTPVMLGTTAPNVTTFAAVNVGPGNWCYEISASSSAGEGAHSNRACIVVSSPPPGAPGTPSVTLTVSATTAYDSIKSKDNLALLPVGTVPLGTVCESTQGIAKTGVWYFIVPVSSVTITGSVKPLAVVAKCS